MDRTEMEEESRMHEEKIKDMDSDDVMMGNDSPVKMEERADVLSKLHALQAQAGLQSAAFGLMNGATPSPGSPNSMLQYSGLLNNNNNALYEKLNTYLALQASRKGEEDEDPREEILHKQRDYMHLLNNLRNAQHMIPGSQVPIFSNGFGPTSHMPPTPGSGGSRESSANGNRTPSHTPEPAGAWNYDEQYKQVREPAKHSSFEDDKRKLYELSSDPKRKEFLDELFSFMQRKGTPINRLPIMAKQVLDLYDLFNLVIERGGLVDVINKKLWQEIIKGLKLPSSITSAAFTLRTQYMKYLYPFECETKSFSSPSELQSAIDGNRREGRRASYGGQYGDMVPQTPFQFPNYGPLQPLPNHLALMGNRAQLNGNGVHPINPQDLMGGRGNSPPMDLLKLYNQSRLFGLHEDNRRSPISHHGLPAVQQKEALDLNTKEDEYPEQWPPVSRGHVRNRESSDRSKSDDEISSAPKRQAIHEDPYRASSPTNSFSSPIQSSTSIKITKDADKSLNVTMDIDGIMYQGVLYAAKSPPRSRALS